ncbi:LysR family transcriptional regulator [Amycolatopsis sp. NPDC004079]|uniref:LysR family transcriptional regulator n=1 Tax=Amycolatopsis sp. NPDC004079 TaxID=3154549 RepID=UPI0033ABAF72
MNLHRLRYFLAVVDAGTVSAAADRLRIAQPALSRQVQTLERELGLELFTRYRKRLQLTPAGVEVVRMARRFVVQADYFSDAVANLATGSVRRLSIAASAPIVSGLLAPFVATLLPEDPFIEPRSAEHLALDAMLRGGVDAVISPVGPAPEFRRRVVGRMPLRAFVQADHAWAQARRKAIGVADLLEHPLIASSEKAVGRRLLDAARARLGLSYRSIRECDDNSTAIANAAAGKGVAVLASPPAHGAYPVDVWEEPDRPETALAVRFFMAWHPQHHALHVIEDLAGRIELFFLHRHCELPSNP